MEARDFVVALIGAGQTQSVIAERTGIPQPTISKVARGDVADVMSRNYRKLQALYESTPAAVALHEATLRMQAAPEPAPLAGQPSAPATATSAERV